MKYRKLGRTDLEVSCIGFGGLGLPALSKPQAEAILNRALDLGMNFIDTARGYRESENLIGRAVAHRRKEYYLATKSRARTRDEVMKEFEASLQHLKTDYIDLYQIHYINTNQELDQVLEEDGLLSVFQELQAQKAAGFIGISGHDAGVLLRAARTGHFDTIQGAFSYLENDKKILDLIHYCSSSNIGFIVQKPLAGGVLAPARAALKWILQHPVSTVIPGMLTLEQVNENAGVAEGEYSLASIEKEQLDHTVANLDRYFCRRCYYCHPACPENIPIGVILEYFAKAQVPENLEMCRKGYRRRKSNALHCTECGQCLDACPYHLPIIDMLKQAHQLLA
ncbi:MAG: aldo/keto reductase [Spirochaetota bacterium]